MFLLLERVGKIISELKDYICQDSEKLDIYRYADGKYTYPEAVDSAVPDWRDFRPGDRWGGYNKHGIFNICFSIPEHFPERQ